MTGCFLRFIAKLVPAEQRPEWIDEWTGELFQLAGRHKTTTTRVFKTIAFLTGAVPHAVQVRRAHPQPRASKRFVMHTLIQDARYALRSFVRMPTFTIISLATMALGIGATTTVFSIVDGVMLRPLPYADAERLVMVGGTSTRFPGLAPVAPANYFDWRDESTVFDHLVATDTYTFDVIGGDRPERIFGAAVGGEFFAMLGSTPLLGRTLRPDDDLANGPRVALLSYGLWQRRFGGDPDIVGKQFSTADYSFTILGVMPEPFAHPEVFWGEDINIWIPLSHIETSLTTRNGRFLQVMGKLKSGVSLAQAREEMNILAKRLEELYPENAGRGLLMEPVLEETIGDVSAALLTLSGAVGILLLISCVNVANLFLARATNRQREMALRGALGAGKGRLYQQLLTEGVLLSVLGGALGLVISRVGVAAFRAFNPGNIPRAGDVSVDARVMGFAFVVSLLTGAAFAMAPAWQASRQHLTNALKDGSLSSGDRRGQHRIRHALVSIEMALAIVLIVSAGLFVKSLLRLRGVDPGFDPRGVVSMTVNLNSQYETNESRLAFFRDVNERLSNVSGVESVAYSTNIPFTGERWLTAVRIEGQTPDPANPNVTDVARVSPGYFATMRIGIVEGREFTTIDDNSHDPAIVVNQAFVRQYLPEGEPLRARIGVGSDWLTVVGVVNDINTRGLDQQAEPEIYLSALQRPVANGIVVTRTGNTSATVNAARAIVSEIDANLPIEFNTLEDALARSVTQPQFYTLVLGSFAVIALVLAAVGIYGTMSYVVGLRTREMGIRMALGAHRTDIVRLIVKQGLAVTAVGAIVGLSAAFASARILDAFLFGITAHDAVTFAAATGVLLVVGIGACYVPALRATRVQPVESLK